MTSLEEKHLEHLQEIQKWKAMGSSPLAWYGWGSPLGMGLGLVCVGVFLVLLHVANIIK